MIRILYGKNPFSLRPYVRIFLNHRILSTIVCRFNGECYTFINSDRLDFVNKNQGIRYMINWSFKNLKEKQY